jgi:hypothetical protein
MRTGIITNFVTSDINDYPESFRLLQQEGILARSCFLTGFEFLLKGDFDDILKGNFYTAFFQISIGLERLLKLVPISNYMLKNNLQFIPEKEIRAFEHNLLDLFEAVRSTMEDHSDLKNRLSAPDSIEYKILSFFNDFAKSKNRYFNISSKAQAIDPMLQWQAVLKAIREVDFTEKIYRDVETITFKSIHIPLQIEDIAFQTGYVDFVHDMYKTNATVPFAVYHVIQLIKPIVLLLYEIASKCHRSIMPQRNGEDGMDIILPRPPIPYYDEILGFIYLTKGEIMRRKRWTAFIN